MWPTTKSARSKTGLGSESDVMVMNAEQIQMEDTAETGGANRQRYLAP
jgi:hypothetical protein